MSINEEIAALKLMGERVISDDKDNDHFTAHPMFAVEQRKRIYGMDGDYADDFEWLTREGGKVDDTPARRLEALYQGGRIGDEHRGCQRANYVDVWEYVQVYFTRQEAEEYIDGQGHNLHDPRINVDSAYRNHGWQHVRQALKAIAAGELVTITRANDAAAEQLSEAGACVSKALGLTTNSPEWAHMRCDDNDGNCCLDCWESYFKRAQAVT